MAVLQSIGCGGAIGSGSGRAIGLTSDVVGNGKGGTAIGLSVGSGDCMLRAFSIGADDVMNHSAAHSAINSRLKREKVMGSSG